MAGSTLPRGTFSGLGTHGQGFGSESCFLSVGCLGLSGCTGAAFVGTVFGSLFSFEGSVVFDTFAILGCRESL